MAACVSEHVRVLVVICVFFFVIDVCQFASRTLTRYADSTAVVPFVIYVMAGWILDLVANVALFAAILLLRRRVPLWALWLAAACTNVWLIDSAVFGSSRHSQYNVPPVFRVLSVALACSPLCAQ